MKDASKLFPIGTVVTLKNETKKIMITGFYVSTKSDPKNIHDYSGCLYPEGLITSEQNLLFEHDQIDKVYYMGYSNEEEIEFKVKLNQALRKIENMK